MAVAARLRFFLALALSICLVLGCRHATQGATAVFHYEDFGPPSMVYEMIGYDWWQWQSHGDSDPAKKYDVRVVVYRNVALEEVKRMYPVNPEAQQDYRYLSYDEALRHLDQQIEDDVLPTLTERLRATRDDLVAKLGPKDEQTPAK